MITPADSGRVIAARAIELFEELLELTRSEQATRLTSIATTDPELARRVSEMLCADEHALLNRDLVVDSFSGSFSSPESAVGQTIGPYRLKREIGRGGMGIVFLAERDDGTFEQRVAVKLVRPLAGADLKRRFEIERRVLGRLQHSAITSILDAGVTGEGDSYLVMEYVEGEPLDQYCDGLRLPLRERLEIFVNVCRAVDVAHRALVLHRDLKPSNVLVTTNGDVKLLDFGIAKLLEGEDPLETAFTVAGTMPFTPQYASPEQILGAGVSMASDVYSLGVMFYELLVGERPFETPLTSPGELVRAVEQRQLELPSSRFGALAKTQPGEALGRATARSTGLRALRAQLSGDLDGIAAKALAFQETDRYSSPAQLADDIERALDGRPISARAATAGYRWAKFAERHRTLLVMSSIVLTLLLAGFGTAVWQRQVAISAQLDAERAAARAESTNRFLASLLEAGSPRWTVDLVNKGAETRLIDVLDEASRRLDGDLSTGALERADLHHILGDAFLANSLSIRARRHFERALELRRETLGETHQDVARSWYYIARSSTSLQQEVERNRRSVEVEERLGREHSTNYPWALADGAIGLARTGLFDEAAEWLERSEQAATGSPYGERPLINTLYRRAQLALATGALDQAEELTATLRERSDHKIGVDLLSGRLAFLEGDIEASARYYQRYLDERVRADLRVVGPPLMESLVLLGDIDRATEIHEPLMADPRREPNFYDTPALLASAGLAQLTGDLEGCRTQADTALQLLRDETQRPTLRMAEIKTRLGSCLTESDSARARDLLREALLIWEGFLGPESWLSRRTRESLVELDPTSGTESS